MLTTSKELLLDAQKNHYAVGAFNVENMEMVQAVVAAAEKRKLSTLSILFIPKSGAHSRFRVPEAQTTLENVYCAETTTNTTGTTYTRLRQHRFSM